MTSQENFSQKSYKEYLQLKEGIVTPCLEELWYLRVPAFVAVLSIIFFAFIPQTLEIYRAFFLNPVWRGWHTFFSLVFIYLFSLSIWYSGRSLSIKRIKDLDEKCQELFLIKRQQVSVTKVVHFLMKVCEYFALTLKGVWSAITLNSQERENIKKEIKNEIKIDSSVASAKVEALLWLPRLLGALPLLALILGLSLTLRTRMSFDFLILIAIGIGISFILLITYLYLTINRKISRSNSLTHEDRLFDSYSQAILLSLAILVFSAFTFPLIADTTIKLVFYFVTLIILLIILNRLRFFTNRNSYISLFLGTILLLIPAFFYPSALPYLLGPISIIAISLSVFVIFTSIIFYFGYTTKIPILTYLLISAFIWSSLNWSDNHRLREIESSNKIQSLPTLEESFSEWMKSRPDKEKFINSKYPVYVVSAQGGGIFAAYHAALTLSRLQDLSPEFASHIFAISGVSGGSVGATVFSSLVKEETSVERCDDGMLPSIQDTPQLLSPKSLEAKAHCLLAHDFLSPLLAAGLFPDLIQRFFPSIPFFSQTFDRARGLEYAFEYAWIVKPWKEKFKPFAVSYKDENLKNPLNKSYYDHWKPTGKAPALVFNTTVVETGERLLISPFTFNTSDSKFPVLKDISTVACGSDEKYPSINFSLSTATFLSARFPIVTPVAWFNQCSEKNGDHIQKISRLADGGYFENSGFSTAFEIGERLKKTLPKDKPSFKIVYLAITDNNFSETKFTGLNELASPILTFINSNPARGRSVIEKAEYEIDGNKGDNLPEHEFRQFYLTHVKPDILVDACQPVSNPSSCKSKPDSKNSSQLKLPLGWYLSPASHEYIRYRIGHPDACKSSKYGDSDNNHCVMKSIIEDLKVN
ncbi:MAG: hypothetical protein KA714_30720 [Limnoraphis sp. WC205]|jgi:hypothetical protein|nr:hypothetical protein [Limnoraphis sp. WC205]